MWKEEVIYVERPTVKNNMEVIRAFTNKGFWALEKIDPCLTNSYLTLTELLLASSQSNRSLISEDYIQQKCSWGLACALALWK